MKFLASARPNPLGGQSTDRRVGFPAVYNSSSKHICLKNLLFSYFNSSVFSSVFLIKAIFFYAEIFTTQWFKMTSQDSLENSREQKTMLLLYILLLLFIRMTSEETYPVIKDHATRSVHHIKNSSQLLQYI